MRYPLTKSDFDTVFRFAIKYHLDISKPSFIRTSGATRGLGGVMDSFVRGKLVEIGVSEILKKFRPEKEYILDFEIKNNNEVSKEPDIVAIAEKGLSRKPSLFVEIKNIDPKDRWIGLTEEQLRTIKKEGGQTKVYIIGATLENTEGDKNEKEKDFVGSYLKNITKNDLFKPFANLENTEVEIEFAFTAEDLEKNGNRFSKDSCLYETEVFQETGSASSKAISLGKIPMISELSEENIDPYKMGFYPAPNFGPFKIRGKVSVFEKKNPQSKRVYLLCHTPVKVSNEILGNFILSKGKIYLFNLSTLGRNPILDRNNIWIAKRKIAELITEGKLPSVATSLRSIADSI